MSEVMWILVGPLLGVIGEVIIFEKILRWSNGQSPTTWRIKNSSKFKELKKVYFQEEYAHAKSDSYH